MGMFVDSTGRLARPRLLDRFRRLRPGGIALVRAPAFSGATVLVEQWLEGEGLAGDAIWWTSGSTMPRPEDAPGPDCPAVVVIQASGRAGDSETVLAWRELAPRAILVVRNGLGFSPRARAAGIRADVSVNGRDLLFDRSEVAALAALVDLELPADQVESIIEGSGGFATFVDAAIAGARAAGAVTPDVLRAAGDETIGRIAAAASDGVLVEPLWECVLLVASAGTLSERAVTAIGGLGDSSGAAMRSLRDADLVREVGPGRFGLPAQLASAALSRLASEDRAAETVPFVEAVAGPLVSTGLLDEVLGWAPHGTELRARLLQENWRGLDACPAAEIRAELAESAERTPELDLARARAVIDTTHAGHGGAVSAADRTLADALLASVGERGDALGADARSVLAVTEGIARRVAGDPDAALARHEAVLHDAVDRPWLAIECRVQAALSTLEAGDFTRTKEHLDSVRAVGAGTAHPRMAQIAGDLSLDLLAMGVEREGTAWWRHEVDLPSRAVGVPDFLRRIRTLSSALHRLGVDEVRACLDVPLTAPADDPLTLGLYELSLRASAAVVLGGGEGALREIEMADAWLADRPLRPHHREFLRFARVEALASLGRHREVVDIARPIVEDPSSHLVFAFVLARALVALDDVDGAERVLDDSMGRGLREGWYAGPDAVARAVVAHRRGDEDQARAQVSRALQVAARTGDLLPFAGYGEAVLAELVDRAEDVAIGAPTARVARRLAECRRRLLFDDPSTTLTRKQTELLAELTRVTSTRELSQNLGVSPNTVKSQLRQIYRKLGVSSWREAADAAREMPDLLKK
ncbi:regulatory protein, LuxR [Actinomycetales bacterium JB111]|nr:regulatory protein, LuxR [Actinomycetales bacterium JB111]